MMAVSAFALGMLACGGGDNDQGNGDEGVRATATAPVETAVSSTPSANAERIAQAAMISVTDLPGTGWQVAAIDDYSGALLDGDGSEFADSPACLAYFEAVTAAAESAQTAVSGRASRSFTKADSVLGASVYVDVTVYQDDETPRTIVDEAERAFSADGFDSCFEEVFSQLGGGREGARFSTELVDSAVDAPADGIAEAVEMTVSGGVSYTMRAEIYAWADDETFAFVTVMGSPESITSELVTPVVNKTAGKLSAGQ
jgi:hypothetical protein